VDLFISLYLQPIRPCPYYAEYYLYNIYDKFGHDLLWNSCYGAKTKINVRFWKLRNKSNA